MPTADTLERQAKAAYDKAHPPGWGVLAPGVTYTPPPVFGSAEWMAQTFGNSTTKVNTTPDTPGQTWDPNKAARDAANAAAAAQAAANAAGKASSRRENENTRSLVEQQHALLDAFGKSRDVKLGNIQKAMDAAQALLLKNYGITLGSLEGNALGNEKAEADASFSNVSNAVRERASLLDQAASMGAGETDLVRTQLQALRNYSANQGEVNRSFFDTLQSINNSINSLNSDTSTSRTNIFNQAESDRESAQANYNNQLSDTWTQIGNIENANTNTNSDSSEAYNKLYADAGAQAAAAVGNAYQRQTAPDSLLEWDGKGTKKDAALTSSNQAASINLGGPQKKPEGATLRTW